VGCNIKYRYIGKNDYLLVVDNKKTWLRAGQLVELPEHKVKTTKLNKFLKQDKEQDNITFSVDEVKILKKMLKDKEVT